MGQTKKNTRPVLSELDFSNFDLMLLIVHRHTELMLLLAQEIMSRNACELAGEKFDRHWITSDSDTIRRILRLVKKK
jgi:hypothetical protein